MEQGVVPDTLDKISKNGDVIFEVGEEATPRRRILVSSAILSNASTAFAALLGPHFREGQLLASASTNGPVTIPLPEDEPQAMSDLLRLLHLINVPELAWADDFPRIFAFALAADKWCCVDALHLQSQGILLNSLNVLERLPGLSDEPFDEGKAVIELANAAYLLNQHPSFCLLVMRLLLRQTGSYLQLSKKVDGDVLPLKFYFVLEERRTLARHKISSGLTDLATWCLNCHEWITSKIVPEFQKHLLQDVKDMWQPVWQEPWFSLETGLQHDLQGMS
ncbi:hypothetical protein PRZ48_013314 [Zasmidium cellare]|uniref:BTB domain-containing protein n=1 Tax=Zasmidium cellare TaxID=395010 RepID=A0ABR0E444_ZASCE|nr:hypothetical protein PRZ48_013314 [Zasmidium cellare]